MRILIALLVSGLLIVNLAGCAGTTQPATVVAAPNATWPDPSEVQAINTVRKESRALSADEQGAFKSWFNRTITLFCKLDFINRKSDEECLNGGQ